MRAIFIDSVNRKVEDVQVKNELHAFYDRIGCDMIDDAPEEVQEQPDLFADHKGVGKTESSRGC